MEDIYADIRPYNDDEIPQAMERVASDPLLKYVADYAFPGMELGKVQALIRSLRTTEEIQSKLMYGIIRHIVQTSVTDFTVGGVEKFEDGRGRLLVTNHRDITLDAFMLQYVFYSSGLPTSDITLGDNLLRPQFVVDLCRSNRMIKIIRKNDVSPREFLENSRHLSEYLRLRINSGRSIWIAQRNGRTKDGIDMTEPGLLKMLGMGSAESFERNFAELNITPVSISYEIEPCDMLKAIELAHVATGETYHKSENEDQTSILTGILSPKGQVHIEICDRITEEELAEIARLPRAEQCKALAEAIDSRIIPSYHLFGTSYISHDILSGNGMYSSMYTAAQKSGFEKHLEKCREGFAAAGVDIATAERILLGIYANPVDRVTEYRNRYGR